MALVDYGEDERVEVSSRSGIASSVEKIFFLKDKEIAELRRIACILWNTLKDEGELGVYTEEKLGYKNVSELEKFIHYE